MNATTDKASTDYTCEHCGKSAPGWGHDCRPADPCSHCGQEFADMWDYTMHRELYRRVCWQRAVDQDLTGHDVVVRASGYMYAAWACSCGARWQEDWSG